MALHPISVVDRVLDEYRSYLKTEFRARDPKLRQALEEALDEPRFLAQEPFFQAHRPFAAGAAWSALGLDPRIAKVMVDSTKSKTAFLHQSDAIAHLLGPAASPLVVTTGTGSGKTECFLLPVLHNAIEDATAFKRNGVTAILVYPMNALANDQEERIKELLEKSGHTHLAVAKYDRQATEDQRKGWRANPPHILLTNYVMLEYLLVRPADRDALFANHRCRYIVLDEVHTYRGALGANIALLFRRLLAHLSDARHDWQAEDRSDIRRFPQTVPVGTSATIKSVDETGKTQDEVNRLRDDAVQDFFSKLTGVVAKSIKVIGETLGDLPAPAEARWLPMPADVTVPDGNNAAAVQRTLASLAGLPAATALAISARHAGILWKLNHLLARRPLSVTGIVAELLKEPERQDADPEAVRREVHAALVTGAALPDGTAGHLRLRAHRFIRGGWSFHRCVDPSCGKIYAMGADRCTCKKQTAPLHLCRSCGADVLRFRGDDKDPSLEPLQPNADRINDGEWVLYDTTRDPTAEAGDEDDLVRAEGEIKSRPIVAGSFDPESCAFSSDAADYRVKVTLAPSRNRCLVCGASMAGRSILTPVSLGTSAAVRVLAEGLVEGLADENRGKPDRDGKERLLIFADSRQDAAHQARFITYAGRYDRMRRRVVRTLANGPLTLSDAIQKLMEQGVENNDNPMTAGYSDVEFLNQDVQERARAWEAAPLLDDLAMSAGYRATVFNIGLVGVRYGKLDLQLQKYGQPLATELGITLEGLGHVCRCFLDEIRRRGAVSHPMLMTHSGADSYPPAFRAADWERRIKTPYGYAFEGDPDSRKPTAGIVTWRNADTVPDGITLNNAWRRARTGGLGPGLERRLKHLLKRLGGVVPTAEIMLSLMAFLADHARLLKPVKLTGWRKGTYLLQIDAGHITLAMPTAAERFRCSVCNVKMAWSYDGAPCPVCHGSLEPWPVADVESNRYVGRIRDAKITALVAAEHTAQVTGGARHTLEQQFKSRPEKWPLNVLACSPTLEMGINIGGLDAVMMRNVPPRPDNYAQRGGRAGRSSRVGVVLSYTRATPHDGYFYDKPAEMIAGEVRSPGIGLGNRDVVLRHLHAIAIGSAVPGLSGRMGDYISIQGELLSEPVEALIAAVAARFPDAVDLALRAWGDAVLKPLELETREALLAELDKLPDRIRNLFDRVRLQIVQLDQAIERWRQLALGDRKAVHAMDLKRRLLGIRSERDSGKDADDRTTGHPMRRFAEFGILPGYEFPAEPCTVRLLGDESEEEPISVERRFGLAQYQPDARAHARGHRWRVIGLDMTSPWNPKNPEPSWTYVRCQECKLCYGSQEHAACPRCQSTAALAGPGGGGYAGYEYGGFVAVRDDTPVLEEEDRFAISALVQCHPQHDGRVIQRWQLPTGWSAALRREEEVRWVNEWKPPSAEDKKTGAPQLSDEARGFWLCGACGKSLEWLKPPKAGANRRPARGAEDNPYKHLPSCTASGDPPVPHAITSRTSATTYRIQVVLPPGMKDDAYASWGQSLGYALRTGMRLLYMLDGTEIEFELESMFKQLADGTDVSIGTLCFIDAAVGGSGFLDRAATELHLVAQRAIEHLDHPNCETACYRCLKSYQNQRVHSLLAWPLVLPDLEQLASSPPETTALERGDVDDPRPWLEAFDAGVGSPLELKFLRVFEAAGIAVQKQKEVAADPGGPAISIADFVVPDSRVAIYVDGASFHRGQRLRRDRQIRVKLREGGNRWTVLAFGASDLKHADVIVAKIRDAVSGRVSVALPAGSGIVDLAPA